MSVYPPILLIKTTVRNNKIEHEKHLLRTVVLIKVLVYIIWQIKKTSSLIRMQQGS
jgi:hypothetical protein